MEDGNGKIYLNFDDICFLEKSLIWANVARGLSILIQSEILLWLLPHSRRPSILEASFWWCLTLIIIGIVGYMSFKPLIVFWGGIILYHSSIFINNWGEKINKE
ncbi:hypothetical protein BU200_03095 [Streptococcus acidominimus]|uniref:Uncharacterized protein n=1 Tax=Streptococcus acidominimus TaxID=1326 RepID=A0A1Q8EEM0_STRAI|nr:hypothetical protein BU200_03095 [Streptococcus acidominimus]